MTSDFEFYEMLLNIKDLKIEQVVIEDGSIHIHCKICCEDSQPCPLCTCEVSKKTPKYRRKIRDLDISGRKVFLHLQVHQFLCDCGRTFSEEFEFVQSGKSYTKRQGKWIVELSGQQSHTRVGALVDMSHKTVERICYRSTQKRDINWSLIKRFGIDEFAFKKGHKDFIVILVDLDTHEIIDLLPFRDKASISQYFNNLGEEICAKVTDYCSDMWGPFQDLAKELFPNATIHIDRFHWTVHLNKTVDGFRKALRREDKDEEAFKKLKWKLIKRPEKLSETEVEDLQKAFEIAPELEEVYQMKNTFQAIFDTHFSHEFASTQIDLWLQHAKALKNQYLNTFIELFERHRNNIMNYFKNRISSGVVEGKNNLLRTIKRFTFNMTNFEHFKARVFAFNS